jgi:D-serine deaminase-like pyridoxal phosphate-dependent protein
MNVTNNFETEVRPDMITSNTQNRAFPYPEPAPETPFLSLDPKKLVRNARRLQERIDAVCSRQGLSGVLKPTLRPHVKTVKSIPVFQAAFGPEPVPITVSTFKEAEQFAAAGFTDMIYAVGISPNKLDHALALRHAGVNLRVLTDNIEAAHAVAAKALASGQSLPCLIEIDTDQHRAGVAPSDHDYLLAVGRVLGTQLAGVLTHAGESYSCRSHTALVAMAEQERSGITHAAEVLRAHGLPCPMVSLGSTPTVLFGESFVGVTDLRAGVYLFQDLVMAGLGVCETDDIAVTVTCSVIGHQKDKGWIITDAGWMALSRDRGTAAQTLDQGYGLVCDASGQVMEDVIVADTNQEHGILKHRHGKTLSAEDFPVGMLLRVLPNHACATSAQHPGYHLWPKDSAASGAPDFWPRFNAW